MKIISYFLSLSLPIKIISSSFVVIVAGPGFLYFLTEYATYFYVMSLGVRPPFEGAPYLSATVAFLSIILAVCASLIFISTRLIIGLIGVKIVEGIKSILVIADLGLDEYRKNGGHLFQKLSFSNTIELIEKLSLKHIIGLIFGLNFLILLLLKFIGVASSSEESAILIFTTLYTSIALLTLWSRLFSWIVAIICVLIFYASAIVFLFDSEKYRIFLQLVGYGGGIPIKVEYQDNSKTESLNLIIRTSTSLLTERDLDKNKYFEIPLESVKTIVYKKFNTCANSSNFVGPIRPGECR